MSGTTRRSRKHHTMSGLHDTSTLFSWGANILRSDAHLMPNLSMSAFGTTSIPSSDFLNAIRAILHSIEDMVVGNSDLDATAPDSDNGDTDATKVDIKAEA
ncbi:hypothetical protein B0H13DRAFT_1852238 [Mycena leptocephala]|nr:hypothetical protein B0H13DRAFT_1852238 [Mycena leptocephala]